MNSKELLEQAGIKVKRINELSDSIGAAEDILSMLDNGEVCFFTSGIGTTHLTPALPQDKMQKLREAVVTEIIISRNEKTAELEQLLGFQKPAPEQRKPATINQDFENAVQEMIDSVKKPKSDPVESKLSEILKSEAKRIEAPEDKSMDKYPAKRDGRKKYPENMTVEDVTRMYVKEGKNRREIAAHYGVKESTVNNFLFLHDIKRTKRETKKPAETDDKEHP